MTFLAAMAIVYGPPIMWFWWREREKDRVFDAEMHSRTAAFHMRYRKLM